MQMIQLNLNDTMTFVEKGPRYEQGFVLVVQATLALNSKMMYKKDKGLWQQQWNMPCQ